MLSPFELCLTWAGTHARARAIYDGLSAATVELELLGETLASVDVGLARSLEATRAEIAEVSRESRALVEAIAKLLPGPGRADLGMAVRDTLAPLHRYLARREAVLVEPDLSPGVLVAVEPELLRYAVAGLVDGVVALAAIGETIRLTLTRRRDVAALEVRLEARREPPDPRVLDGKLASLRPWLEQRGGVVAVAGSESGMAVVLTLPLIGDENSC